METLDPVRGAGDMLTWMPAAGVTPSPWKTVPVTLAEAMSWMLAETVWPAVGR